MGVSKKKYAAIDTVPTPDFEGMTFKKGTVVKKRDRYVLKVGARLFDVPATAAPPSELRSLQGRSVYAAFSKSVPGAVVAIGTWPTPEKPRWILCYIPAPELLRRLDRRVREELLRGMVAEGVVSEAFAREVKGAG